MSILNKGVVRKANEAVRLDAWRGVFEKTNRIMSGRPVTVSIVSGHDIPSGYGNVPGWTDGEAVHFNGDMVKDMLKKHDHLTAVLRLKGLNYHELCHVLYTPRTGSDLPKQVIERAKSSGDTDWWYAFNALEDQRIETWFAATYGPSRRYFEAAVLQWLLTEGNAEAALLIYGRKYLQPTLRVKAGRVFVQKHGAALYAEFQMVIDQYLMVDPTKETVRALSLVGRYYNLLKKMQQAQMCGLPPMIVPDNGCNGHGVPGRGDEGVVRKGRVFAAEAADAKQNAADMAADAAEADKAAEAALDTPPTPAPAGEGGLSGAGQPKQADGVPGQGAGDGAVDHNVQQPTKAEAQKDLADAVRDLIKDAAEGMDDLKVDDDLIKDAAAVLDAVRAVEQNGQIDAEGVQINGQGGHDPVEGSVSAVRKIVQILGRLRTDMEPETLRDQRQGRLDARRYLARQPHQFEVFKAWDEGSEEQAGVEVVVLLDVSGSMSRNARQAAEAVWVLKRAFDKTEVKTTVMVFDTGHKVLYQPRDKATGKVKVVNTGGGTDPTTALQQAHKILLKSAEPNKVLVTVTDGQWGGQPRKQNDLMRDLSRMGVTSMLLALDGAEHYGTHQHTFGKPLEQMSDLPKAVTEMVTRILRQAARRA